MRFVFSLVLLVLTFLSSPAMANFGQNNSFDQSNSFDQNTNFNQSSSAPNFASGNSRFVPVDEAFAFNAFQQGDRVFLDWQIKPGYYLYQQHLSISAEQLTLGEIEIPQGAPHQDEFFGKTNIYTTPLSIEVPLKSYKQKAQLLVQYQGCAKAGFCYPPEIKVIDIAPFKPNSSNETSQAQQSHKGQTEAPKTTHQAEQTPVSSESHLAAKLSDNWWTPLLFLALGVGLAFTPCVLPMYPILTSIVLGSGKLSHKRALGLAFIYVQGMALTYTLLGLVVASAGMQFQAAMQHPYVLIGLSILFVVLALSMFGVYTLQLPNSVQTWLSNLSNKQQGGNTFGVFIMGAISGLVCSPCTTAPLSGALLYVAQSGDLLTGAIALYALALGMGIPLILVAVFGNQLLPKAGAWMDRVKTLFGFILLAAPIFLLERILPHTWSTGLWSALGIAAFGWLYHVKNSLPFGGWKQSLLGIIALLGLFASAQPALNYYFGQQKSANVPQHQIEFIRIANVEQLNAQLAQAKSQGKAVMLDFYADWCVACKEFEKYTFHQPNVESKLKNWVLLQADVTRNQEQDIALLKHMQVLGLPTIEFWTADGEPLANARITGFMDEQAFLAHLKAHNL